MISTRPLLKIVHPSIRDNFDLDSNATEESDPHSEKHHSPKTSIHLERLILAKPVSPNAPDSLYDNLDLIET
jgi:hypothetical protein